MEAVKQTRFVKPVVAYKTGSSRTGDQASLSHTGSLAGRQEIYEGALRQSGVLYVDSTERLLDAARALNLCPLPEGNRVAILSSMTLANGHAWEYLVLPNASYRSGWASKWRIFRSR